MGKVKRLELWWQLYLYVTSGSGLRKKPAITLCAFECTWLKIAYVTVVLWTCVTFSAPCLILGWITSYGRLTILIFHICSRGMMDYELEMVHKYQQPSIYCISLRINLPLKFMNVIFFCYSHIQNMNNATLFKYVMVVAVALCLALCFYDLSVLRLYNLECYGVGWMIDWK
jgi:hypothetical protein